MSSDPRLRSELLRKLLASARAGALVTAFASATLAAAWSASPSRADEEAGTFQPFGIEMAVTEPTDGEIASSTDGALWFIETGEDYWVASVLVKAGTDGRVVGEFPLPGATPGSLTPGPAGEMWFTDDDEDEHQQNFIGRVSPTGRITEYPIPNIPPSTPGDPATQSFPTGIALGPDGDIWVTLSGSGTIARFSRDGALLSEVPTPHHMPRAIAVGTGGDVWFSDADYVGKINPAGEIEEFLIPLNKTIPHESTTLARGITVGPDGTAWVIFTGFYEGYVNDGSYIAAVSPSGGIRETPLPNLHYTMFHGLVAGPDGNIWFGGNGEGLSRITPAGEVTTFAPVTGKYNYAFDLAIDPSGNIWYGPTGEGGALASDHYSLWRFVTPLPPIGERVPLISGATSTGDTLTTSDGTWRHKPATVSYQWQTCDANGANCANISGATSSSHQLAEVDVGHSLRAVVTVSGLGGSASAISLASSVITGTTASGPGTPAPTGLLPLPAVTASWKFTPSHRQTIVGSLIVRGLPPGALVRVGCRGSGCPFGQRRVSVPTTHPKCSRLRCPALQELALRDQLSLGGWFSRRRLHPGTHITVRVSLPGHVEKLFEFTIRAHRAPNVQISCLESSSSQASGSC